MDGSDGKVVSGCVAESCAAVNSSACSSVTVGVGAVAVVSSCHGSVSGRSRVIGNVPGCGVKVGCG